MPFPITTTTPVSRAANPVAYGTGGTCGHSSKRCPLTSLVEYYTQVPQALEFVIKHYYKSLRFEVLVSCAGVYIPVRHAKTLILWNLT